VTGLFYIENKLSKQNK